MKAQVWFAVSILACGITWTFRHTILIPWEHYVDVQRGNLKAQMGDLYPRWVGTRELLLHGRNPYGEEVSHEIQMAFYGHEIRQKYGVSGVVDEQRFAYPVYVVLLLAPGMRADFLEVQAFAIYLLGSLTVVAALLCMAALKWRPPPLLAASVALFLLSSPQVGQGLRLQQLGLFVGFLLAFAIWCLTRDHYFAAGVLLAIATIKPQMIILCLAWLFLWSLADWTKRWSFFAGFGMTLVGLVGLGEVLLPGWIRYFISGLIAYRKYVPAQSLASFVLGSWGGSVFAVLGLAVLSAFAWRHRGSQPDSDIFLRILSLFLLASTLVFPLLPLFNQVLLLLPLILILRDWKQMPRLTGSLFFVLVAWPLVVSLVLIVHPPQITAMKPIPLLPSVFAPFLPFLLVLLIIRLGRRDLQPRPTYGTPGNASHMVGEIAHTVL